MKGGKREGAGRPALSEKEKKVPISILLPRDLLTVAESHRIAHPRTWTVGKIQKES